MNIEEKKGIYNNPLLGEYGTPFGAVPYDRITLEHFIPAVEECIRRENEVIEGICDNSDEATFENTIAKFDYAGTELSTVICAFNALINSRSYDEILAVEEKIQQMCTRHQNSISMNDRLFTRIKEVYEADNSHLDKAQKRLLEQTYKSFIRNGANLTGDDREEYRRLTERLSLLAIKFQENNIKDTDAFTLHITDEADIAGLPEDVTEAAANNAKENGKEGWLFTLHRPSYIPFITFCNNRELRRRMYMAYSTTSSKGNEYDNR